MNNPQCNNCRTVQQNTLLNAQQLKRIIAMKRNVIVNRWLAFLLSLLMTFCSSLSTPAYSAQSDIAVFSPFFNQAFKLQPVDLVHHVFDEITSLQDPFATVLDTLCMDSSDFAVAMEAAAHCVLDALYLKQAYAALVQASGIAVAFAEWSALVLIHYLREAEATLLNKVADILDLPVIADILTLIPNNQAETLVKSAIRQVIDNTVEEAAAAVGLGGLSDEKRTAAVDAAITFFQGILNQKNRSASQNTHQQASRSSTVSTVDAQPSAAESQATLPEHSESNANQDLDPPSWWDQLPDGQVVDAIDVGTIALNLDNTSSIAPKKMDGTAIASHADLIAYVAPVQSIINIELALLRVADQMAKGGKRRLAKAVLEYKNQQRQYSTCVNVCPEFMQTAIEINLADASTELTDAQAYLEDIYIYRKRILTKSSSGGGIAGARTWIKKVIHGGVLHDQELTHFAHDDQDFINYEPDTYLSLYLLSLLFTYGFDVPDGFFNNELEANDHTTARISISPKISLGGISLNPGDWVDACKDHVPGCEEVSDTIEEGGASALTAFEQAVNETAEWAGSTAKAEAIINISSDITSGFTSEFENLSTDLLNVSEEVLNETIDGIELGVGMLEQWGTELGENVSGWVNTGVNLSTDWLGNAYSDMTDFVSALANIVADFFTGNGVMQELKEAIADLVDAAINDVNDEMINPIEDTYDTVKNWIENMVDLLGSELQAIYKLLKVAASFSDDLNTINFNTLTNDSGGQQLVNKISSAVTALGNLLAEGATEQLDEIVEETENAFATLENYVNLDATAAAALQEEAYQIFKDLALDNQMAMTELIYTLLQTGGLLPEGEQQATLPTADATLSVTAPSSVQENSYIKTFVANNNSLGLASAVVFPEEYHTVSAIRSAGRPEPVSNFGLYRWLCDSYYTAEGNAGAQIGEQALSQRRMNAAMLYAYGPGMHAYRTDLRNALLAGCVANDSTAAHDLAAIIKPLVLSGTAKEAVLGADRFAAFIYNESNTDAVIVLSDELNDKKRDLYYLEELAHMAAWYVNKEVRVPALQAQQYIMGDEGARLSRYLVYWSGNCNYNDLSADLDKTTHTEHPCYENHDPHYEAHLYSNPTHFIAHEPLDSWNEPGVVATGTTRDDLIVESKNRLINISTTLKQYGFKSKVKFVATAKAKMSGGYDSKTTFEVGLLMPTRNSYPKNLIKMTKGWDDTEINTVCLENGSYEEGCFLSTLFLEIVPLSTGLESMHEVAALTGAPIKTKVGGGLKTGLKLNVPIIVEKGPRIDGHGIEGVINEAISIGWQSTLYQKNKAELQYVGISGLYNKPHAVVAVNGSAKLGAIVGANDNDQGKAMALTALMPLGGYLVGCAIDTAIFAFQILTTGTSATTPCASPITAVTTVATALGAYGVAKHQLSDNVKDDIAASFKWNIAAHVSLFNLKSSLGSFNEQLPFEADFSIRNQYIWSYPSYGKWYLPGTGSTYTAVFDASDE